MATSMSTKAATKVTTVNLLDLASACVACTVTASRSIRKIAEPVHDNADANVNADGSKNIRLKDDGSFVTDADFAAQGVIVQAVKSVCSELNIVGEESAEEMAQHMGQHDDALDEPIFQQTRREIRIRLRQQLEEAQLKGSVILPLAQRETGQESNVDVNGDETIDVANDPLDKTVDASRVTIIVDPLDGTKSYAKGDYDSVSILIAIIVDNEPCFGVIGKPFGYPGLSPILDTGCVSIYGGPLLGGVFVAGGNAIVAEDLASGDAAVTEDLPRAVISGSRSKGVVHDFCVHLGSKGLIYPEPMLVSGAGEKSLRLILQYEKQALWFFPKGGTSLWDVAAPDALLRSLGGKLTDKFGKQMDYSKPRDEAENVDGVIACIDAKLHAECIRLFQEGDWGTRS
jgi:3'-phosphoadenosine 5'-phosphosulfate (PAPS) 3'-phosphatase